MQRANKKTRAVLGRSFQHLGPAGDLFVERYLREVVFDHEFHYDVSDDVKEALQADHKGAGQRYVDLKGRGPMVDTMMAGVRESMGANGAAAESEESAPEEQSAGQPCSD